MSPGCAVLWHGPCIWRTAACTPSSITQVSVPPTFQQAGTGSLPNASMSAAAEEKQQQVKVEEEQPNNKRKLEEEEGQPAAQEGDGQPPAKVLKTEDGAAAPDAAGEAEAEPGEAAAEAAVTEQPVQIGYKTFPTGKDAYKYYHGLISKLRKYQNLNDVSLGSGKGQGTHARWRMRRRRGPPDAAGWAGWLFSGRISV